MAIVYSSVLFLGYGLGCWVGAGVLGDDGVILPVPEFDMFAANAPVVVLRATSIP